MHIAIELYNDRYIDRHTHTYTRTHTRDAAPVEIRAGITVVCLFLCVFFLAVAWSSFCPLFSFFPLLSLFSPPFFLIVRLDSGFGLSICVNILN